MDIIKITEDLGNSYPPSQNSVSNTTLPLHSTSKIAKTIFTQHDEEYEKTEKSIYLDSDMYHTDFGETIHGHEKIDKGIVDLFIQNTAIPFEPKQMEILIKLIQVNSHIALLSISCDIGSKSTQLIAEFLRGNTTLTSLDISDNKVGNVGAKHIAKALEENTTLTFIDLESNEIGDLGAEHIAKTLERNTALTFIDLESNEIGDIGAEYIAKALKGNTTLTFIDLESNEIGDIGAEHIAKTLERNTTLTSLNLGNNNIGAVGLEHIAKALEVNKSITSLGLSWNSIGNVYAEHITKALEVNKSITSLNLENNRIGAVGAKSIARVLKAHKSFTSLNLGNNEIGDLGAKYIADALKENITLTSLDLRNNEIGNLGAKCIADALKGNTTLTFIDFSGMDSVNETIKRNEGYVSSLKEAVKEGNRSKAEELIKIGVSPINRLNYSQSPFDLAIDKKNYTMIDLFLSKGFFFPCNPLRKGIRISVGKLPRFFKVINAPFKTHLYPNLVDIILSYSFDTSFPRRYIVEIREKTDEFLSLSLGKLSSNKTMRNTKKRKKTSV